MYVCVCNKLPENLIKALIEQGWDIHEISETTGCSQNCGSCRKTLEELVEQENKSTIPIDLL